MNPWSGLLGNLVSVHIKQHLYNMLKDRYMKNEPFIDRLTSLLTTERDIEGLGRFVADLYELGYLKSLEDHREILQARGMKVTIKPEVSQEAMDKERIFPT